MATSPHKHTQWHTVTHPAHTLLVGVVCVVRVWSVDPVLNRLLSHRLCWWEQISGGLRYVVLFLSFSSVFTSQLFDRKWHKDSETGNKQEVHENLNQSSFTSSWTETLFCSDVRRTCELAETCVMFVVHDSWFSHLTLYLFVVWNKHLNSKERKMTSDQKHTIMWHFPARGYVCVSVCVVLHTPRTQTTWTESLRNQQGKITAAFSQRLHSQIFVGLWVLEQLKHLIKKFMN